MSLAEILVLAHEQHLRQGPATGLIGRIQICLQMVHGQVQLTILGRNA